MKKLLNFLAAVFTVIAPIAAHAESLEVTSEKIYQGTSVAKGTTVEYARFTVVATDLQTPVYVYMTGAQGKMFSVNLEQIPVGSSTTDVIVSYSPTAVGKHTGRINFESINTELNCGYSINTVCIDPANPPTISIDTSNLKPFSCKAGETQKQTITVTTKGLPDYGNIKLDGKALGNYLLSSTMLMKESTATITITFTPKANGTYNETITASALEATPVTINITGTASAGGDDPEAKEGDELPLVTDNPRVQYSTSFDGVTRNKPLALDGWKNLALKGTRAWWGYGFEVETEDPLKTETDYCAKVTCYDSKVAAGAAQECQMMLVSPPLNFKDAVKKEVTFRLMGQYLTNDESYLMEVCYLDMADGSLYTQPIEMQIPCTADESNTWFPYVLDFTGQEVADTFFIGFRFTAPRGIDCSATYYVDDFTWGGEATPYKKGDVNGDGIVDVADVNVIINIILGDDEGSKYNGRADVNGDGKVDVADVNALINLMLE